MKKKVKKAANKKTIEISQQLVDLLFSQVQELEAKLSSVLTKTPVGSKSLTDDLPKNVPLNNLVVQLDSILQSIDL